MVSSLYDGLWSSVIAAIIGSSATILSAIIVQKAQLHVEKAGDLEGGQMDVINASATSVLRSESRLWMMRANHGNAETCGFGHRPECWNGWHQSFLLLD
ncbi:hypothetical protein F4803DRAFT_534928 [Xylaria telfairii]|nr:hypothetical protein F4803DRAFT_534928 [Xylaria telfairii]